MRHALVALALCASFTAPAAAQDGNQPEIYDFEDDLVEGGRYTPMESFLQGRRRAQRETLIRARAHWIPELTKSVENL